jgi:hypothetical protein
MPEPSGHTLLTDALAVIRRALEAHREEAPWREIVARTSGRRGPRTFAVAVSEGDPARVIDSYVVRVHEGRFEVVEQGRGAPVIDWNVAVEHLRRIVADPDRYIAGPEQLDLGWLVSRLCPPVRKSAGGWQVRRTRRPS